MAVAVMLALSVGSLIPIWQPQKKQRHYISVALLLALPCRNILVQQGQQRTLCRFECGACVDLPSTGAIFPSGKTEIAAVWARSALGIRALGR